MLIEVVNPDNPLEGVEVRRIEEIDDDDEESLAESDSGFERAARKAREEEAELDEEEDVALTPTHRAQETCVLVSSQDASPCPATLVVEESGLEETAVSASPAVSAVSASPGSESKANMMRFLESQYCCPSPMLDEDINGKKLVMLQ